MLLLITTTTFYLLSGIIASIAVLYEPYAKEKREKGPFEYTYDLVIMLIIVVIQLVKFVLRCCLKKCITFSASVIWILIEALVVQALAISTL